MSDLPKLPRVFRCEYKLTGGHRVGVECDGQRSVFAGKGAPKPWSSDYSDPVYIDQPAETAPIEKYRLVTVCDGCPAVMRENGDCAGFMAEETAQIAIGKLLSGEMLESGLQWNYLRRHVIAPPQPTSPTDTNHQIVTELFSAAAKGVGNLAEIAADVLKPEREKARELFDAVKAVVTQRADDLCWRDVYEQLARLVGVDFCPELIVDQSKFLENCKAFDCSLRYGGKYHPVNVERVDQSEREKAREEIERLKAELVKERAERLSILVEQMDKHRADYTAFAAKTNARAEAIQCTIDTFKSAADDRDRLRAELAESEKYRVATMARFLRAEQERDAAMVERDKLKLAASQISSALTVLVAAAGGVSEAVTGG